MKSIKKLQKAFNGLFCKDWTILEFILYVLMGISRKFGIYTVYFNDLYGRHTFLQYVQRVSKEFYDKAVEEGIIEVNSDTEKKLAQKLKWSKDNNQEKYIYIDKIKIPYKMVSYIFRDHFLYSFLVYYVFNDNYDKKIVEFIDKETGEGPYGYVDGNFKVEVKNGDIVIDAGAFSGDFSAYATVKGAKSYAFEPMTTTYNKYLLETVKTSMENIIPVNLGLSDKEESLILSINGSASSFVMTDNKCDTEVIHVVTLDKFVEDNGIERVDFIKADIEGAERSMLKGATKVLQKFAPKLAICTYHLPDDPEVLERIILDVNPAYKIVHTKAKLFAMV